MFQIISFLRSFVSYQETEAKDLIHSFISDVDNPSLWLETAVFVVQNDSSDIPYSPSADS